MTRQEQINNSNLESIARSTEILNKSLKELIVSMKKTQRLLTNLSEENEEDVTYSPQIRCAICGNSPLFCLCQK